MIFGLAAGLAAVLRLVVGPGVEGLSWPDGGAIWEIRLQALAAAAVVGACLAVAGVMLQSLLGNPLASPDLLGLASGAGLAVLLVMYFEVDGGLGGGLGVSSAAVVGAIGALGVVYVLAQREGLLDPVSLILVGVIVSILCGAAAMFVAQLMPARRVEAMQWMLGSIDDDAGWGRIGAVGVLCVVGVGVGLWLGRAMDAAALSEDEARSVGVSLSMLRIVLFVLSGVLTAGAVVLAGPIGFVGLVCPHVARMAAGPGHRVLIVGAALAGIALVVGADALVMGVELPSGRMPIGVLTALIGGPVFLWLLREHQRGRK